MSKITTHILDVSLGRPAANIVVTLETQLNDGSWSAAVKATTDAEGRVRDFPAAPELQAGVYRLLFDTRDYFAAQLRPTLYPQVSIIFEIRNPQEHHHIPLLLSPFGYSTYRGS